MKFSSFTPYKGGKLYVAISQGISIPDSIEFSFSDTHQVTVDFWLVQTVRSTIECYPVYSDSNPTDVLKENKIQFIKAVRRIYSLGLKEAKEIAEWFMDNVDRSLTVRC